MEPSAQTAHGQASLPPWAKAIEVTANARLLYSPGVSEVSGSVLAAAQGGHLARAVRRRVVGVKGGCCVWLTQSIWGLLTAFFASSRRRCSYLVELDLRSQDLKPDGLVNLNLSTFAGEESRECGIEPRAGPARYFIEGFCAGTELICHGEVLTARQREETIANRLPDPPVDAVDREPPLVHIHSTHTTA